MGRLLLILVLVTMVVLGASIGYFNSQTIRFNYLAGETHLPLVALIVCEMLIVVIITLLVCAGRMLALRGEIRRLRRQLQGAEAELKNLRNLPLKDV